MTEPHVLQLSPEQVVELRKFIDDRKWHVPVDTLDAYKRKTEVAETYIKALTRPTTATLNGRHSPEVRTLGPVAMRPKPQRIRSESDLPTSGQHQRVRSEPGPPTSGLGQGPLSPFNCEKDFEQMRMEGIQYKTSFKGNFRRGSTRKGATPETVHPQGEWRKSGVGMLGELSDTSDIAFQHFLVADTSTVKVITRLSTDHVASVSRVPVRIVLLVDRSGSMLQKIGRDTRHTKITKVKHFALQLISSLDEGDQVAIVTFGDDGDIFFPLTKLDAKTRPLLSEKARRLDQGTMSLVTNLSAGIRTALRVFFQSFKDETAYLESKNSILIFSDGEINAGTTEAMQLVHETRQSIRQMVPSLDDSQNQWVTISVVTTGSGISEAAYMLSKTCSSEAYYYINKDTEDTATALFLPVLLRKTAVAWNISYVIQARNGIEFVDDKCSRDNRIRLRRSISGHGDSREKAFFMYDFPAGHARQLGVCVRWNGEESLNSFDDDEAMLKLRVEFTNIKGERFWQEQIITKEDIIDSLRETNKNDDATAAVCKHEMQMVSADVLHAAAEHVKAGDNRKSRAVMLDGQKSLQAVMDEYGAKSHTSESAVATGAVLKSYAKSVVENLGALIDTVEQTSKGEAWNKMKAVSTAISRESPNIENTVVNEDVLCPLPVIGHFETDAMKDPLKRLMGHKRNNRMSLGLEKLLEETLTL
ncbi:uncharacterized protein LOC128234875 isoform X2 [Mya arenaria]|uniref:uncharacterized protein LOC128234875 isoform X2 n=1 Tax=Mya arenaria TaxID=6604 RepID=UPI0022E42C98|nr:uncharacterized protein LOC128234875 isoform X2 [Mya arenaria]